MITPQRSVLVVDDDEFSSDLLRTLLERNAFHVDVERDGIHVIEPKQSYDVILLDLNMPILDGERLTEYWHLTQPELLRRVIIISGFPHFRRSKEMPTTYAVIDKPFDHQQLVQLVERCAAQTDAD